MNKAKKWAANWVEDDYLLKEFEWKFETLDLENLINLRFSSCGVGDPCFVITPSDQKQWFEAECKSEYGKNLWGEMLEEDGFNPDPRDPQEMVFSFHQDEYGSYLEIWEGHHRLAAAYIRGIKQLTVVVGRKKRNNF